MYCTVYIRSVASTRGTHLAIDLLSQVHYHEILSLRAATDVGVLPEQTALSTAASSLHQYRLGTTTLHRHMQLQKLLHTHTHMHTHIITCNTGNFKILE